MRAIFLSTEFAGIAAKNAHEEAREVLYSGATTRARAEFTHGLHRNKRIIQDFTEAGAARRRARDNSFGWGSTAVVDIAGQRGFMERS